MDSQVEKHICGVCNNEFASEEAYVEHTCTTGFTPAQPEHLGPEFLEVQKSALERGKEAIEPTDEVQIARQEEAIQTVVAAIESAPVVEEAPQAPVDSAPYQAS